MHRRSPLRSKASVLIALLGGALLVTNTVSAQQITLVSSASDGTPADVGGSVTPSISADGRSRVSVTSTGQQINNDSSKPKISADGRFVVFETDGALVPEDTNMCTVARLTFPCTDVYVHDRQTSATTRVSVSSAGTQTNFPSVPLDISGDGRFVLFYSVSPDLVNGDTNNNSDVFLRDRQTSTTTRVGVDANGNQLSGFSSDGRMSADGRFIVYRGISAGVDEGNWVFLLDRQTGTVSSITEALPGGHVPNVFPFRRYTPSEISDDGRYIVVLEEAPATPALVYRDRHLLHDRVTGHTVATAWRDKTLTPTFTSRINGLSGDGRTFANTSIIGTNKMVVLTDRVNGLQEIIPMPVQDGFASMPLSADGRFTAFATTPSDGAIPQVYVYDRDSGDGDGMPSAWETTFGLNPGDLTDANADADSDGVTNLQEFVQGTHPTAVASATRYFAEGAANPFFTTRLAAVNPGDASAAVVFRFLGSGGQSSSVLRTIAPRSRITLDLPANGPTPSYDFSTVIESDRTVVVDRTMTWDSTGYGAHTETSLAAPSTTWHLAEGATHGAFDLFYLLQNPNASTANVTINYLRQAPFAPVSKSYTVEPNSRKTIPVDGEGPDLEAVDVAAAITSDLPIVVERAMYSTRPGQPAFAAGHGAAGVTAPALRWFLAEGATGNFFDLYVLVSNPNTTASTLKVTYLLPAGAPFEKTYSVGPQQRLTIYVQDEDPRLENTPVSVIVESTNNQPVVVERAMWFPKGEWHEAHVSAGATTTGTRWALADGEITIGGDTYILIANTSTTAGTATVTLLEEGGTPLPITVDLPPSSRVNVSVSAYLPVTEENPRRRFGALIDSSGVEIVVERSIYATAGGIIWGAGTSALGTKLQ
jgi:Tol biopolymer transport system component